MRAAESSLLAPAADQESALPAPVLLVFLCAAVLGLLTANPWLTAAAIAVLPLFIVLLWRPGEPPVLLFAVGFQWLQVTAKVFHANVNGVHVNEMTAASTVEGAIWMSLTGLVVLSGGMWLALRGMRCRGRGAVEEELMKISTHRAFLLYLLATALASLARAYAWSIPGLTQPLIEFSAVRWAFFFLLAFLVFKRREKHLYLAAAFAIEFISGIGFFSGFKTVLFVTLIAVGAVFLRMNAKTVLMGAACGAFLLILGSAWTVVKPEYRAFLDTQAREGTSSRSEQITKLAELAFGLTRADLAEGMEPLFRRVAYVEFFAHVTDYVPEVVPHERGALWLASVQHVLTPRLLNPNKPELPSDSELTMQYTGLRLAGVEAGTSISIGYMGESYIDFGPLGMFVPIFILGLLWGLMYRYFVVRARAQIIGYSIAVAVLLSAYMFEIAGLKLLGGMTMGFIVFALLMRFLEPVIWRWLTLGAGERAASWPLATPAYHGTSEHRL